MIITRDQGQSMVASTYTRTRAVACYYCTGFGKGKAALDAVKIESFRDTEAMEFDGWGLIVAHNENARDKVWPVEIDQWLTVKEQKGTIDLTCYQSLAKYAGKRYKWLIMDEIHYLTRNYLFQLKQVQYEGIIVMTGTKPEDADKQSMIDMLSKNNSLEIKLDMAVDSNILNDYRVRIWKVEMTAAEKEEYLRLSKKIQNFQVQNNQFMVKVAGGHRMRFIYNLHTKYQAGCWVRDRLREAGRRFVIFCGSIEMCNKLSPYRKHNKTNDTDYDRFCRMEINEIASIKEIKEGANINRLQAGLAVQLNSKQHNFLQELGRLMRLEPYEIATMHVIMLVDTVDENWVEKAIQSLNRNKVTYHSINRDLITQYV